VRRLRFGFGVGIIVTVIGLVWLVVGLADGPVSYREDSWLARHGQRTLANVVSSSGEGYRIVAFTDDDGIRHTAEVASDEDRWVTILVDPRAPHKAVSESDPYDEVIVDAIMVVLGVICLVYGGIAIRSRWASLRNRCTIGQPARRVRPSKVVRALAEAALSFGIEPGRDVDPGEGLLVQPTIVAADLTLQRGVALFTAGGHCVGAIDNHDVPAERGARRRTRQVVIDRDGIVEQTQWTRHKRWSSSDRHRAAVVVDPDGRTIGSIARRTAETGFLSELDGTEIVESITRGAHGVRITFSTFGAPGDPWAQPSVLVGIAVIVSRRPHLGRWWRSLWGVTFTRSATPEARALILASLACPRAMPSSGGGG
jgi:hypothetical protein